MDDKKQAEFLDFWSDYSNKITEQFSKIMQTGFKEQLELYELWMDTYAKNATEGSKVGEIPSIMSKYWLDIFNRFNDFYSMKGATMSNKMDKIEPGEQLYKQYEEMYNYWINASQKMLDEIMRSPTYGNFLASSINTSMDSRKILKNFMTENLKNMGIPTKKEMDEMLWELRNITARLEDLEQQLRDNAKAK